MGWAGLRSYYQSRSLSSRLYCIIVPTTVLAVFAAGYLGDRIAARMADAAIRADTVRVTTQLASTLSREGLPLDLGELRRRMGELVELNNFITRIDVYEVTGNSVVRLVTTSSSDAQSLTLDEMTAARELRLLLVPLFRDRERFLKVVAPLSVPDGGEGAVTVTSSLRESDLLGEVHSRVALLLVPATVLLLVPMLHYFFTRVVTRRIGELLAAMTQVEQGDLRKRVLPGARDELGGIALRFNRMMDAFEQASRQRDQLLDEQQGFTRQLEERVAVATRDLTAANEQLRTLNRDLVETQRRLTQLERAAVAGQMAASFAHEIGSPLSAMSTHLQLLLEDPETRGTARERLKLIQDQLGRITAFVEEMLAETRATAQSHTAVQLNQLLKQLLLFLEQELARLRVRVETSFTESLPEVPANPQQLQQVFLNLINNACDAMSDGGTLLVATTLEPDVKGRPCATVRISDDGTGIPAEKQERIFEPFFTTKDLRRGTGLGLTIAAWIIRQHKGSISVKSRLGEGSTFTVQLPLHGEQGRQNGEERRTP